jgi:hypothetical protein
MLEKRTYTLSPSPVSRHEIAVTPLVVLKLAIWSVVDATSQVRVSEDVVNDLSRVTVPDLMVGGHPLGRGCILWTKAIVLGSA